MGHSQRLTQKMVFDARPVPDRAFFLWDGDIKGFGCKIEPGGTKSFVLQYRTWERLKRRVVLGRVGVMTLEEARRDARAKLGDVAKGGDPAKDQQNAKNGLTVGALCDWYLEEATAGRLLGRNRTTIKSSSLAMDRSRIESHIRPLLGRKHVAKLRLPDIEAMQIAIAEGKTARPRGEGRGGVTRGGKGAASRSVSTIHSIFAHAKRAGLIEANPALGVRKFPDRKKTRRLNRREIREFGAAMRDAAETEHPVGLAILRLLVLAGLRLNEAQSLQRRWVVEEESYIAFGDTKTGAQSRAIGAPALRLIQDQPDAGTFIFPSDGGRAHFVAADTVLGRLCHRLGWDDVTAHTLRHTFGSIAGELGFSELTIAAMLGHAAGSVTSRYVHIDEAVRSAVERVSREIEDLLDGKEDRAATVGAVFGYSGSLTGGALTSAGLLTVKISRAA